MRVAFIQPPSWHLTHSLYRINRPLAGPSLAAVLNSHGHNATFMDCEALGWFPEQIGGYIRRERPDAICFTVLNHNRQGVTDAIKVCRHTSTARILAGGPYATSCPDEMLSMGVDAVCVGEGEGVIREMVEGSPSGVICGNAVNLDNTPIPDHSNCTPELSHYNGNIPHIGHPEALSLWARGCPHRCNFCSNPVFGRQSPRLMSSGRVLAEIRALKARGIKVVFVYSDELVGSSRMQDTWLENVCDDIARGDLKLSYKTQGRCSKHITLDTLDAMSAAGFKVVMWGIESLSQRVLDNLHKNLKVAEIWHTLTLAKKAGLQSYGFFMVGGVDETEEDFQTTLSLLRDFYREGLLSWHQVSVMTLEPGALLYDQAKKHGWLPDGTGKGPSHFSPYLNVPWASHAELARRQKLLQDVIAPETRREP